MSETEMLKQFVIVDKSLKMSKGKMSAQVAHATAMALSFQHINYEDQLNDMCKWWHTGMCVIVLQCKNASKLFGADHYCKEWKIPGVLYVDEGFNEVEAMTPTCFATGVLTPEKQKYFSQFELYTDSKIVWLKKKLTWWKQKR